MHTSAFILAYDVCVAYPFPIELLCGLMIKVLFFLRLFRSRMK